MGVREQLRMLVVATPSHCLFSDMLVMSPLELVDVVAGYVDHASKKYFKSTYAIFLEVYRKNLKIPVCCGRSWRPLLELLECIKYSSDH